MLKWVLGVLGAVAAFVTFRRFFKATPPQSLRFDPSVEADIKRTREIRKERQAERAKKHAAQVVAIEGRHSFRIQKAQPTTADVELGRTELDELDEGLD